MCCSVWLWPHLFFNQIRGKETGTTQALSLFSMQILTLKLLELLASENDFLSPLEKRLQITGATLKHPGSITDFAACGKSVALVKHASEQKTKNKSTSDSIVARHPVTP